MAKKIQINPSEPIYEAMVRWAKKEGRPIANLALRIIEARVQQALSSGEIPPEAPRFDGAAAKLIASALSKMIDGELLTPDEEAAIAEASNRPPSQVHDVVKKLWKKDQ